MSTRSEQETILRWAEDEEALSVWTASPVTFNLLKKRGYKPFETHNDNEGKPRSWKYKLPLGILTIRSARSMVRTPAQIKAALEAGARLRARGSQTPPKPPASS